MTVRLAAEEWQRRRAAHEARVDRLVADHLERRRNHVKHPVVDFLFTYYNNRPGRLRRWHPGAGVILADAEPPGPEYVAVPGGAMVDHVRLLERRRGTIMRIRNLLAATASRPGRFGCFGLHEWAMVYRQPPEEIRHRAWPLRTDPVPVVEVGPLRCTHFDAFRFFTEPARPRNEVWLTRADQIAYEQPGCLHANMDLYRWAYELSPLVPGELVMDCFELAYDIRAVDMQASPYDLRALGYEPIPVETSAGRAEFARRQREFADRAAPLRARLIAECDRLLELAGADDGLRASADVGAQV